MNWAIGRHVLSLLMEKVVMQFSFKFPHLCVHSYTYLWNKLIIVTKPQSVDESVPMQQLNLKIVRSEFCLLQSLLKECPK